MSLPAEENNVSVQIVPGAELSENGVPVMVEILTHPGSKRTPSDICCVVDVSGSMGSEAMLKTEAGDMSGHGLSVLDVVKHGLNTIIHNLEENDRLALVAYSNDATVIFDLIEMTPGGRQTTEGRLENLSPSGMTNLWDGLKTGLDLLQTAKKPDRVQHMFLFTDGLPNINPPRGILPMLKRMKEKEGGKLPCTISTFGFGYELDSDLLAQLAIDSAGSYNFIPDAGFVGTIFVNAMANVLVTMAKDVELTLKPVNGASFAANSPILGGYPVLSNNSDSIKISLGMLQFGQSKNVVVILKGGRVREELRGDFLDVQVEYCTRQHKNISQSFCGPDKGTTANLPRVEPHRLRLAFVDALRSCMQSAKLNPIDRANGKPLPLPASREIADTFAAQVKSSPAAEDEYVKALLEDVQGQVAEALSREEWYTKWGTHYLPSLMFAHLTQQCNNFKDASVQNFGGELFETVRDKADEIFLNLPPPIPTAVKPAPTPSTTCVPAPAARSMPVNMAAYHNPYSGCFAGGCDVLLADGTTREASKIEKGDKLQSPEDGTVSKVVCVVRTLVADGHLPLVELPGGLQITPHHPVKIQGEWSFPADASNAKMLKCDAVYTYLLEEGGSAFVVNGITCVALGHGLQDDVTRHPFFGSWAAVRKDLEAIGNFGTGSVELTHGLCRRDPNTGLICSFATAQEAEVSKLMKALGDSESHAIIQN